MPFCNAWERDTHFAKHGHKFAATDAQEYERVADMFMFGALGTDTHECFRASGDRLRFDYGTLYFAASRPAPAPECLRTFYPVDPSNVAHRGGTGPYFRYQCDRIDV